MHQQQKNNNLFPFIILFFTFRIILLIMFAIYLGWYIFRSYVQVKVYRIVKQNENSLNQEVGSIPSISPMVTVVINNN